MKLKVEVVSESGVENQVIKIKYQFQNLEYLLKSITDIKISCANKFIGAVSEQVSSDS